MDVAERSALARAKDSALYDLFCRMLRDSDKTLRVQRDAVLLHQSQGRALMLEEIIALMEECSEDAKGTRVR